MEEKKMLAKLKMLWDLLFNSKEFKPATEPWTQEIRPLSTEIEESKPVVEPMSTFFDEVEAATPIVKTTKTTLTPTPAWPFPTTRPEEVETVEKPVRRKRKAIPKSDAVPPSEEETAKRAHKPRVRNRKK